MDIYIFDFEVFKCDWLVIFKNVTTGEYTAIHNNNAKLKEFVTREKLLGGFNVKHYDQYILKAALRGADNALLKEINDFIIGGNQGFEHWFIQQNKAYINCFDLRDDMQLGLSLKAIEGHLGMNIVESKIPFDIDRPLTDEELKETIYYCQHDVDATEKLLELRKDYLQCKIDLGAMKNIPAKRAIYNTNAKITAKYLGAVKREWNDGREYEYPKNLDTSVIPADVKAFFETIKDTAIPDDDLFKTSYETKIGNCPVKYAWGGVHGSLIAYHEKAEGNRVIQNRDVSSLYPSLIIKYNYLSRNAESPETFEATYRRRLKAKHDGDKATSNTLKLPLNIVSGATEQKYNDLFDPKQARSMRISGQLFLTELVEKLVAGCETFKLLNFNTDGLMYSVEKEELPKVDGICSQWEEKTLFELETDHISEVWIKDVNNLLIKMTNGALKTVGGYLNYGISNKGAWNINNNTTIVADAIVNYLAKDVPAETTIGDCTDISKFQFIAKAGSKYKRAYQEIGDKQVDVQMVNRVYASKDSDNGTLYKVHKVNGRPAKIAGLPKHCVIDNDNHLSLDDVDRQFYIDLAHKKINDFLGIKPSKKKKETKHMATAKTEVSTISKERLALLGKLKVMTEEMDTFSWEKDGLNTHQSYKYITEKQYKANFKAARRKAGLLWKMDTLDHEYIPGISDKMHLIVCKYRGRLIDPDTGAYEEYLFEGSGADNGDKALYKSATGGFKFFVASNFNIAENNDPENDETEKPVQQKPPTTNERDDIRKKLTDTDGQASPMQLKSLKKALKKLREADPDQEEFITQVAVKTKGFKTISKKACEELILQVGEKVEKSA